MWKQFNQSEYNGEQLYEIQTIALDGLIGTTFVKCDVSAKDAALTPWYYFVKDEEDGPADEE